MGTPTAKPFPDLTLEAEHRFWEKADLLGDCWNWVAGKGGTGYGAFYHAGRMLRAHRVAWALMHGQPADPTLVLDHLCRNRACVNPAHMRLTTNIENILAGEAGQYMKERSARQTHCKRNHEFTPENTRIYRGARTCVECRRLRDRVEYKEARNGAA